MKKVLIALLLMSTVIGMTMPAMANPHIKKVVNNDQDATNWATSTIAQSQENSGDLVNNNAQIALGGDAKAKSEANANANAQDQSSHDVGSGDDSEDNIGGLDNSGATNVLSGNAGSLAAADGGDADNGDNFQENSLVQIATAEITTTQDIVQIIDEVEELVLTIEDSAIVEGNEVEDESAIVASGDEEAEINL
ncbi:hypothetical protein [Candidatus Methanoperedens nitratireducens]|uniref:Uncharacterized protein n=1 Tax=Candidatus Methanoperedens nitratireducens TaxID=1392998 RepID=A0A284VSF8_9EURY|nr:hypothetical protein [Candidatus Methanoperedens nitroreducens]SNQ62138.1 exported hypothetical protein [Candidatus Methanoperedens nitroreducens]